MSRPECRLEVNDLTLWIYVTHINLGPHRPRCAVVVGGLRSTCTSDRPCRLSFVGSLVRLSVTGHPD